MHARARWWEAIDVWLPWRFRLADIEFPVHVWHGEQDENVKLEELDFMLEMLPNAQLTVWPDAGHIGLAKHWREILDDVIAH